MTWEPTAGTVELPSGFRLRGRSLRAGPPAPPAADWTLLLLGKPPEVFPAPHRWLRWRDFGLPADPADARDAFEEAHRRVRAGERVDVACFGGRGRTGTAIACIARLDGVAADQAVAWTRAHYDRRAAEMPWQRRFVRRLVV